MERCRGRDGGVAGTDALWRGIHGGTASVSGGAILDARNVDSPHC